ncbi:MAG: hypothetical protein AVDCRST_MAG56-432 [uncultured Cytophagales bacterium]|uniref:Uncharacterized protein n=1 Tax=uncultured Cytophagales bacterium TaxID=158755 RepID=A0A6J4HDH0_9SPHI|nr:MAG: hypothetical protein AVDCRST_MAG56-432 [uncultured Cytophagales bacterium]
MRAIVALPCLYPRPHPGPSRQNHSLSAPQFQILFCFEGFAVRARRRPCGVMFLPFCQPGTPRRGKKPFF